MKVVIGSVVRMSLKELKEKCAELIENGRISFEDVDDHLGKNSMFSEIQFMAYYHSREQWLEAVDQEEIRYFLKHFGGPFLLEYATWKGDGLICEESFNDLFNDSYSDVFVQFLK